MKFDLILLDGETRSALAACRSLGKLGLNIAVVGPQGCITHGSRFCKKQLIAPAKDFQGYLQNLSSEIEHDLLLPVTDRSVGTLVKVGSLKAILPPKESLDAVQDKSRLLAIATKLGINAPRSEVIEHSSIISSGNWSSFPAVIKSALSTVEGNESWQKRYVTYLSSAEELHQEISQLPADEPFLLQEQIVGEGIGVFCLLEDGSPIVTFAHRRILEKPPSGGVSVLSESISLADAPIAEAHALLKELHWSGVAMVEFKRSGNGFSLMEINPRFWGSLQLSICSGVDFPALFWFWSRKELESDLGRQKLAAARDYRVGSRLRWDLGTLDHLFIRLKREGFSAFSKILLNNELKLFSCGTTAHETMSWDDPWPFFFELRNYFFK